MAGYNYGGKFSSNNAIAAENEGKITAGKIAKKYNLKIQDVFDILGKEEYHHTSKFYNKTFFYSDTEIREKHLRLKKRRLENKFIEKIKKELKKFNLFKETFLMKTIMKLKLNGHYLKCIRYYDYFLYFEKGKLQIISALNFKLIPSWNKYHIFEKI